MNLKFIFSRGLHFNILENFSEIYSIPFDLLSVEMDPAGVELDRRNLIFLSKHPNSFRRKKLYKDDVASKLIDLALKNDKKIYPIEQKKVIDSEHVELSKRLLQKIYKPLLVGFNLSDGVFFDSLVYCENFISKIRQYFSLRDKTPLENISGIKEDVLHHFPDLSRDVRYLLEFGALHNIDQLIFNELKGEEGFDFSFYLPNLGEKNKDLINGIILSQTNNLIRPLEILFTNKRFDSEYDTKEFFEDKIRIYFNKEINQLLDVLGEERDFTYFQQITQSLKKGTRFLRLEKDLLNQFQHICYNT